ncbi:MAG: HEAT repeat domain-containing protein [Leptospiraceae bacterium]|nr:HEAT repeat domain-containing protein [Leptospiraceae bacterium]
MNYFKKISAMAGLILMSALASCGGPGIREPEFYDQAEKMIQEGNGQEVASQILENSAEIPAEQKDRAIDLLDSLGPEKGRDALMGLYNRPGFNEPARREAIVARLLKREDGITADFLRTRVLQDPDLYNSVVGSYMLRQGDAASARFFVAMAEKDRSILNGEMANLFGTHKTVEAVPLLKYMAENSVDPADAFDALTAIKDGGAAEYVLQSAADANHPSRLYAVRYLPQLGNNELTVPVLRSIVLNYRSENTEILHQAMESLGETEYSDESYNALKRVFLNVDSTETQAAAIVAMARMRDMEPQALLEELKEEARKQPPEETKKPEVAVVTKPDRPEPRPRPPRKTTETKIRPGQYSKLPYSKAQSARYVKMLGQVLGENLGSAPARNTMGQIHNSFRSYSESSTQSSKFFVRSYMRYYSINESKALELMKEGINVPGSLNAILSNVRREYGNESMQVYALSRFFAIPRWQSQVLLELYVAGSIGK